MVSEPINRVNQLDFLIPLCRQDETVFGTHRHRTHTDGSEVFPVGAPEPATNIISHESFFWGG